MTDSGSNGKKGKGFAGLDSMVSDVSEDVKTAANVSPPTVSPKNLPSAAPSPQAATTESRPAPAESSSSSGSGTSSLGWVIAGIAVLVIWIANSGSGNKTQTPTTSSPTPTYSTPAPASAPAPVPASISDEQKPPVGRDNVLNIPQIRWCNREKVRIEAIESVINNAYEREVVNFNTKVSDYNSRCGEFRYRRGNVEQVDRELASERESIAAKAKSEWVRSSLGLKDGTTVMPKKEKSPTVNKQATAPKQESDTSTVSLSYEERESIESACSGQKTLYGPGAYNKCVSQKISALRSGPRNIDLTSLNYSEKESIESACSGQKTLYGPAEYNKCLSNKLAALKAGPRNVDLSGLNYSEKESIESACSGQKTLYGPAEYNKCLTQKLRQFKR